MHTAILLRKLLKIKDIVIKDVEFTAMKNGQEALIINAKPTKYEQCRCGICQRKSKHYDQGDGVRYWRSLDLGLIKAFIKAPAPRVRCPKHGVVVAAVPWARHDSRFTQAFEELVAWLTLHTTRSVVSEFMQIAWNTVGPVMQRIYDDKKAAAPSQFDGLENIGIDETSYKKGHKYLTVVVNHANSSVIWAHKGHGKEVLKQFFELLSEDQRASIKCVTADGARWIADCVSTYCPNAERCIDPFHVVSWATEALDEVRRGVWREAKQGDQSAKIKWLPGRPRKAVPNKAAAVKESRYALLKNPETLSRAQAAKIDAIAISEKKLYRAYLLKERLRLLLKLPADEVEAALDGWISWARRCRITQFVELQKKIKRHYKAIIATANHGLSNARIEAINNKIKVTIRMGYGFRNVDNLIALIMMRCSGMKVSIPGRS